MSRELEAARTLVKMLKERENETGVIENRVQLSSLNPGEIFTTSFADMVVLEQRQDVAIIISRDFVKEDVVFDENSPDFKKSSIERLLSGEIYKMYENEFGSKNIVDSQVSLTTVDGQEFYGTYTGKIRLLTFDEARRFNDIISKEEMSDWYWTMTPWSIPGRGWDRSLAVVSPSGRIIFGGYGIGGGVRPVCILKSNIFVSKGEN